MLFPFISDGVEGKWEKHIPGGRQDGKECWEEMTFAWKKNVREVVLKILVKCY